MIFATTGTQLPFDRFLEMLDAVAPSLGTEELVVQAKPHKYQPKNFTTRSFIPPDEFERIFANARLIIAHAGMGTIISALTRQKPMIIVPRRADMGEHRNDHQQATARRFGAAGYIHVAEDADALRRLLSSPTLTSGHLISTHASTTLIDAIMALSPR